MRRPSLTPFAAPCTKPGMSTPCVRPRRSAPIAPILAALAGIVLLAAAGCSKEEPATGAGSGAPPVPVPIEVQTAREIAAALFADGDRMAEARAALEPLLHRAPLFPEDLLRAAAVELELNHVEPAHALLKQAQGLGDKSARGHYLQGLLAYRNGDAAEAQKEFERAAELAPGDLPTQLMISTCRMERGDKNAEAPLRKIQALGPDVGASWYPTALYRLNQVCLRWGKAPEAEKLRREFSELQERGIVAASVREMERGNFGRLDFPPPSPATRAAPPPPPAWQKPAPLGKEFAGVTELHAWDLVDDGKIERNDHEATGWSIGRCDLVGAGPAGIVAAIPAADGSFSVQRISPAPVSRLEAFDFGQDGDLEFWAVNEKGIELLLAEQGQWSPAPTKLPALPAPPSDLIAVDYDHEGDLDLLLVGPFGARLWRDDGADRSGAFTDATESAGLSGCDPCEWCVVEDFDSDQDVDLLMGGAKGVLLADNLRGGKFAKRSVALPDGADPRRAPIVADLDGDSRPDLWFGDAGGNLLRGTGTAKWSAAKGPPASPPIERRACATADVNGDGELDLLRWDTPALGVVTSLGSSFQKSGDALPQAAAATSGPAVLLAQGGGPKSELARTTKEGLELLAADDAPAIRLALLGRKDNRRAVGAIVEVRAGASYQRIYWRGQPLRVGLAGAKQADWIRVTWPNGVVQSEMAIPAGSDRILEQKEGLIGSCPFLYAWNGKSYGFVTDVLGVTPLGLPMAPGELVPPDHDEFVLVRGDQLAARDGRFELQFTEELREVTYLDHVHLEAVDHPAETEVHPDERFSFPPFPAPHLFSFIAPVAARRATGSDGRDWTAALAADDLRFAAEFTPYSGSDAGGPASTGQFLGLAPPHWLELEFDPKALPKDGALKLLLTGWFYWTDASVNVASSRTPGLEFVPPILEIPDGKGGWRAAGPPIGFPAGKVKTMVVDVGAAIDRADPRIRISSTLRLCWDSIRLAAEASDAPAKITKVDASYADLHSRGFSRAVELPGAPGLDWFDWEQLSAAPRWNQHPGMYTRYGDVRELVGAIDDRFVVMGSGDALTLHFPAASLPELPAGWRRDFLVFLDGWAKDRDPNTVDALYVEPFPFHGMSGYPYGADEHAPADEAHVRWLLDWETRPARRWIPPLAPEPRTRIDAAAAAPARGD
jgi:tetratricopeptide (TPR) repeat protein